jgi:hypothetical protein
MKPATGFASPYDRGRHSKHHCDEEDRLTIRRTLSALFLLAMLAFSTGCATNTATATLLPGANLSKVKSVYVVRSPADERGVHEAIKGALFKRGYEVSSGPAQQPPYKADAVVTYIDKWMWDITMYLLELTITVRDPNDFPLATGHSMHTSLTRKSPPEMADEVVGNILAKQ